MATCTVLCTATATCRAHVIPVIRSTLELQGNTVLVRENADIRILLDETQAEAFLTTLARAEKNASDSALLLETCSTALAAAISVTIDGRTVAVQRVCRIETPSGPDGETDYMVASEARMALPAEAAALAIALDPGAPATLIVSVIAGQGTPQGRNQVLFPGERSRPIPLRAAREPKVGSPAARLHIPPGNNPTGEPQTPASRRRENPLPHSHNSCASDSAIFFPTGSTTSCSSSGCSCSATISAPC